MLNTDADPSEFFHELIRAVHEEFTVLVDIVVSVLDVLDVILADTQFRIHVNAGEFLKDCHVIIVLDCIDKYLAAELVRLPL